MVLLGDKAQAKACFGSFGDSANLDTSLVHGLRQTCHRLRNHLDTHDGTASLHWSCGILFWSVWRCTFCTIHDIVLEIILDTPDGTPRLHGSCGISFWSIWRQC
jgi:hypothetical protein